MAVELGSLRAELRIAGVFEYRELRSWLKLGAMLGGARRMPRRYRVHRRWAGALLFVPIAGVLCTSIAMFGHEGSHRSFSKSPTRNALLDYFAFPLFCGLGALYWRNKHDRLHHGHPNVEGVDPDIRPFPFASSRGDHEACGAEDALVPAQLPALAVLADVHADGARHAALVAALPRAVSEQARAARGGSRPRA